MIKKMYFICSLLCLLFILSACNETEDINKKEEKLITESLYEYFDYEGSFTIVDIKNQSYGIGSSVNRTVNLILDDYDVEISLYYILSTFSKVTDETVVFPLLDTYIEDYLLKKELGLNHDEYSLQLYYDHYNIVDSNSLNPKEKLNILLGNNEDYTFDDYLNQISYYKDFDLSIYNESNILESDLLMEFLIYIRGNNNIEKFSFYIEDENYILDLNSETDNKRKNIDEFLFEKGDFDKSDMSNIYSILNNNFDDYEIIDEFTPLDFNRGDSVFYKVKDNVTNEEFTVWTFNTYETNQESEVISYSAGSAGLSLYTDRFTRVVNSKLRHNNVGELKVYSDGYYSVKLNGFNEEELNNNFEAISSTEIDNLGFAIILNDSIENTNTNQLAKYIFEINKLLPYAKGNFNFIYTDDEELLNEFKNHTYQSLMKKDNIWRVSTSKMSIKSYDKDLVKRFDNVFELTLSKNVFLNDNGDSLSIKEIENVLLKNIERHQERNKK